MHLEVQASVGAHCLQVGLGTWQVRQMDPRCSNPGGFPSKSEDSPTKPRDTPITNKRGLINMGFTFASCCGSLTSTSWPKRDHAQRGDAKCLTANMVEELSVLRRMGAAEYICASTTNQADPKNGTLHNCKPILLMNPKNVPHPAP